MSHAQQESLVRLALPASGHRVTLRHPTGLEDMLLAEGKLNEVSLALAFAESLGRGLTDTDWTTLPACDLEALLLLLRRVLIDDRIMTDIPCTAGDCGARIDISFSIDAYLAHHRPRRAGLSGRGWSVQVSSKRTGWYELSLRDMSQPFAFRLPTIGDQLVAANDEHADAVIARACLDPADMPSRARRAAERAMQLLAPDLADELQGRCPECGAVVTALFEPRRYCLKELRDRAAYVYEDVDTLAQRYGWSEQAILSLPSARRTQYAELARAA